MNPAAGIGRGGGTGGGRGVGRGIGGGRGSGRGMGISGLTGPKIKNRKALNNRPIV